MRSQIILNFFLLEHEHLKCKIKNKVLNVVQGQSTFFGAESYKPLAGLKLLKDEFKLLILLPSPPEDRHALTKPGLCSVED